MNNRFHLLTFALNTNMETGILAYLPQMVHEICETSICGVPSVPG